MTSALVPVIVDAALDRLVAVLDVEDLLRRAEKEAGLGDIAR
jgi:hypothetical protein